MNKNHRQQMRPREVPPYQDVMRAIIEFYGCPTKACAEIGLSDHRYRSLMIDDEITVGSAKIVMAGYQKMKQQQRAA